ncbi:MAG: hypothetical protein A4E28_02290 [Methanocella sp. PtaU1.Bin125]|nr:MAG: hypothetical protein A4E28_02290 [Methanocella sp. PtaU1.Bin125]
MSRHIKVSESEYADDIFLKGQHVTVGGKSFRTPIKAIDAAHRRPDITIKNEVKGLNEICKYFNEGKLTAFVTGARPESLINAELENTFRRIGSDEAAITFTVYDSLRYPSEKGINFLMNLSYEYSDATPLPLLPKLFKDKAGDFEQQLHEYLGFMQQCIDSVNRLNNKSILGVIPAMIPSSHVQDVVKFYYDNDITSFVIDYMGRTPKIAKTSMREFVISLKEYDLIEKSFLYAINVTSGNMMQEAPAVKAVDLLSYGYGFDALGDNHIRRTYPPAVAERMRQMAQDLGTTFRLFNNADYGYYKTPDLSLLESLYPHAETSIPFDNFRTENVKTRPSQILFNSERTGLETIKYRSLIKEEADNTAGYFETKTFVDAKDLKELTKFRKHVD